MMTKRSVDVNTPEQGWSIHTLCLILVLILAGRASAQAPFPYIKATAYHVLPETHNNQSGYSSVCVGPDGSVYVGTAKYGENSFLVEFDPESMRQKIVIDTHKLCGLSDKGYAAQAKIHTRNFVGPSGKIYVGSKQSYPTEEDKKDNVQYGGGYVMTYDPRTGVATNLGMPMKGQGVIDVVADESRKLLYIVTCEEQHWMVYDEKAKTYTEIGPILAAYASTLVDSRGVASAITKDFKLAQYDPATKKVTTRDILIDGKEKWTRKNDYNIPIWQLAADGRTAYTIQLNVPTLLAIDLLAPGETVTAKSHGMMTEGKGPDCRTGLTINPADGMVYALISTKNETGYGQDKVHTLLHLTRFDPKTQKIEDLGVLTVANPDWFTFTDPAGKPKPWIHGFPKLPDGTFVPIYNQGLTAAADGTLYAIQLYPYTLLKIDAFKKMPPQAETPAQKYIDFARAACEQTRNNVPQISQIAEKIAQRHIAGGLIGVIYNNGIWPGQSIAYELHGRAGGIMHIGFDRPWKPEKDRNDAERANDVAIVSWQREPAEKDLALLKEAKAKGQYIIGFGPKSIPALAEHVQLCDVWLDTGLNAGDLRNQFVNIVNGWVLCAEIVSACTRQGKTPIMWKAFLWRDGLKWMEPYFLKKQFHDDDSDGIKVAPIPAGVLGVEYLDRIEYLLRRFRATQLDNLAKAADLIAADLAQGKRTIVAYRGLYSGERRGEGQSFGSERKKPLTHPLPWVQGRGVKRASHLLLTTSSSRWISSSLR